MKNIFISKNIIIKIYRRKPSKNCFQPVPSQFQANSSVKLNFVLLNNKPIINPIVNKLVSPWFRPGRKKRKKRKYKIEKNANISKRIGQIRLWTESENPRIQFRDIREFNSLD